MSTQFRLLTSSDADAFRQLRLQAIATDAQAFLSDQTSEEQKTKQRFAQELVIASLLPPYGYYGCFVDDRLAGYVQISPSGLAKQRHVAFIYNLYFHPDFRRQGLASQLLQHIKTVLQDSRIERVFGSCIATNQNAMQFYQRVGFTEYGRRPKSVKWHDQYDDEIELVLVV